MIPLWDIWVRLFHWSLAVSVLFLWFSGETGTGFIDWHGRIGEFVLSLVVFRILWGIWGSTNASLLSLVQHPAKAFSHIKDLFRKRVHQERRHNAAGGWAVLCMLLLIATQAITGLFIADEDELIEGRFYGALDTSASDFLYSIHHTNAILIQTIIVVHVLMIALYWLLAKQNLIWPMITGKMRWHESEPPPVVTFKSFWFGLLTALIAALFFIGLFIL